MTNRKTNMPLPECDAISKRLRRIEGQIRGVVKMIEDGRDCIDVVNQLSAAKKAFDSAAMFAVIAMAIKCSVSEEGVSPTLSLDDLRKLAGTLA